LISSGVTWNTDASTSSSNAAKVTPGREKEEKRVVEREGAEIGRERRVVE
jgi:hypothetical protein